MILAANHRLLLSGSSFYYICFMRITKLHINQFHHISALDLKIGERLTAIAGQNGIGKTSILGLLGHVCKDDRHKSGFGKTFETEYSEIFKLSYPEHDKAKDHDYVVYFDNDISVNVLSLERKERGKPTSLRFRTWQYDKDQKKSSESKVEFPVLYLGLKRLIPQAQEPEIKNLVLDLTEEEIAFFKETHNEILLIESDIKPQKIETTNKLFYAATTDKYNNLGNSAGQDNIGQIITAIISFQRLKNVQNNDYKGGILLIDELDATLYSASQEKLISFLFTQSSKLNLQVVFTTHSIDILNYLLSSKYKYQSEVCYLHKSKGKIEVLEEKDINKIISDLTVRPVQSKLHKAKTDVYLEDSEAAIFLRNILKKELKDQIDIIDLSFSGDDLLRLVKKKVPSFLNSIIVLDSDKLGKLPKNLVRLPGNNERPEDIMYKYLKSLEDNDAFWGDIGGYTKQMCFRDLISISHSRDKMKEWFNSQLPNWGLGARKLFTKWKKDNSRQVDTFNQDFENALNFVKSK